MKMTKKLTAIFTNNQGQKNQMMVCEHYKTRIAFKQDLIAQGCKNVRVYTDQDIENRMNEIEEKLGTKEVKQPKTNQKTDKSIIGTVEKFETGISINNLKNWSVCDATKEFIQNCVYAKSILKNRTSIIYNEDTKTAIISNNPSGFEKSKLLIGESNQNGVTGAPGEFGEGMKVAFAVLLRNEIEITVQTNGFKVIPELRESSLDSSVKTLWYMIDNNGIKGGTTVEIKGIEREDLEKACSYFILADKIQFICENKEIEENEEIKEIEVIINNELNSIQLVKTRKERLTKKVLAQTNQNGILGIADDNKGKIYVNGVLIQEIPALFDYNFIDTTLINRDRSTINTQLLKSAIREVLKSLENKEYMKVIIKNGIEENESIETSISFGTNFKFYKKWKSVGKEVFGNKVCMAYDSEIDKQMRYRNFRILNVNWEMRDFFKYVLEIKYSSDLLGSKNDNKRIAIKNKNLTENEKKNLKWSKSVLNKYYNDCGIIKITENLEDQFENSCLGIYDRSKNLIWLDRNVLNNQKECFETLIHEMAHKYSHAADQTSEFENELGYIGYLIAVRSTRKERGEVVKSNRGRKAKSVKMNDSNDSNGNFKNAALIG